MFTDPYAVTLLFISKTYCLHDYVSTNLVRSLLIIVGM